MNLCLLIGTSTVFPLVTVLMYTMTDMEAVINSALPSAELIYQATGSKPVTIFLMSWIILAYASAICSAWVASGRITWAFARDVRNHHYYHRDDINNF
jgi:choline transport protein